MIIHCKILYKERVPDLAGLGVDEVLKESDLSVCLDDVSAIIPYDGNDNLSIVVIGGKEMLIKTKEGHKKILEMWQKTRNYAKYLGQSN
jgi:hypothetical protein